MKTAVDLQNQFETERQQKWWTNPVCHGEIAFASWDYQNWLEHKLISRDKEIISKIDEMMEGSRKRYADLLGGEGFNFGERKLGEKISEAAYCKALTELKQWIKANE